MPLGIEEAAWCKMFKVALMPALVSIHQIITHTPPYSVQPQVHWTQRPIKETDFINCLKKIHKKEDADTLQVSHMNQPKEKKKRALGYYVS